MTTHPAGRDLLPVSCTLGPADGGQRLDEWRHLIESAGTGREVTPGRVILSFQNLPDVGVELERLVGAERLCCAFLGWELVEAGASWRLHVTGTDEDLRALTLDG